MFHHRHRSPGTAALCLYVMAAATVFAYVASIGGSSTRRIDALLRSYERVSLSPIDDQILLSNWKLAARDREPIHLTVNVFSRSFDLTLRRGRSVYLPDAKIVVHDVNGPSIELVASEFGSDSVEGYVIGDPDSYVHGHVVSGVFDGIISTAYENYYVESASKFFDSQDVTGDYDAVVYRESDVILSPNIRPRQLEGSRVSGFPLCMDAGSSRANSSAVFNETSSREYLKATSIAVPKNDVAMSDDQNQSAKPKGKSGSVCKVKAVIDHTFYRAYARSNLRKAVGHVEFHIREADRMFSVADFDMNGQPDNIHIRLAALEVYKSKTDVGYLLGGELMDATVYLQKFTGYNHDGMCAAMAFSHRPFKDDVLGYAYRGGPNHAGGICYPRRSVSGQMRSLNVGLTSTNAPWGTLAAAQSVVVVTHELGHMFGAMHDEDADSGACFYANRQRHYIMSSMANPGRSAINRRFSKCSRKAIHTNMQVNGKCLQCRGRECGGGVARLITDITVLTLLPITLLTSFYLGS